MRPSRSYSFLQMFLLEGAMDGTAREIAFQVGTSTPVALITFSRFFRASGTYSASSSLRLLMHSWEGTENMLSISASSALLPS